MAENALERGEVKKLIRMAFLTNQKIATPQAMTVARIARMIGYKPSQKLRNIVNEMVIEGVLKAEKRIDEKAINGFVVIYWINPEVLTGKLENRQIKINGQLGLWS